MAAVPGGGTHFTENTADWRVIATDGTGYASLADLAAAGKTAWPGLEPGMFPANVLLGTENGSGAEGDDCYIAFNKGAAFSALASEALRDNEGILLKSGADYSFPGVNHESSFQIWNLWASKQTAGDELIIGMT